MIFDSKNKIIFLGDKRLREVSSKIPLTDIKKKIIHSSIEDMFKLMKKEKGAGLAMPQLGILNRLFIVEASLIKETDCNSNIENVFINPEIISKSSNQSLDLEGCLSIPNLYGEVSRSNEVCISAFNQQGKRFQITAKNFYARVILHEYDHLDGILFIDRMRDLKSLRIEK